MVDSAKTGQRNPARADGRAGGHVEVLSTDAAPFRERFSYWREVVCTAARGFFGTVTDPPPGDFSARAVVRSCGPFRFMAVETKTSYQVVRTRRNVAHTPPDFFEFCLLLSGEVISIRGEETNKPSAGDFGFHLVPEYRAQF